VLQRFHSCDTNITVHHQIILLESFWLELSRPALTYRFAQRSPAP
jgi:hypothetical protein